MLLTEEEARTKVCPTRRYCINENGVIQDRESAIYVAELCQGSRCIAWRWRREHRLSGGGGEWEPLPATHGYCGLAGRPE